MILVSHFHFDHIGDRKLADNPDAPTARCDAPLNTTRTENSNTAEIAVAKNSAVLAGYPMHIFLGRKIANIRGTPTPACPGTIGGEPAVGLFNEMIVPRTSPCQGHMSFGTRTTITRAAGTPGVRVAMVHAQHDDTIAGPIITESLRAPLAENGLDGGYGGAPNGYVLSFSNGLKLYLSGDTGQTSDMLNVVHRFYAVNLAVVNMDGVFVMGPEEAEFAVRSLIQPQAVILSHVTEAATVNGAVQPGTRTARFLELLPDFPVFLPISGRTMEFNGDASCVAGCAMPPGPGRASPSTTMKLVQ